MRSLILAIQFLTRLPTPQLKTFDPAWLADAARWFAAVGVLVGAVVWLAALAGSLLDNQTGPWLAALFGLLAWLWVTGGLHIDGLADLADAQGAAHRSRERFLEVLKDPHLGSFGVLTMASQLLAKLVLLMLLVKHAQMEGVVSPNALRLSGLPLGLITLAANLAPLLLVPAWARLFSVAWSATLLLLEGSKRVAAWRG